MRAYIYLQALVQLGAPTGFIRPRHRQTDPLVRTGKHIARTVYIKFHAMTVLQHGIEALAKHDSGEIDELPSVEL